MPARVPRTFESSSRRNTRRCRAIRRRRCRRSAAKATDPDGGVVTMTPLSSDAFARLFEAVHEGVFIGLVGHAAGSSVTLAANPHLRLMFGLADDVPAGDVKPFEPARFVDSQARTSF